MPFNVAFIGPGIMGRPMALNLLRAGHKLRAWARRAEALQPLTEAGAIACASAAEAAREAEVIFIMVSDTLDVEAVLFGAHGVAEGARRGNVVVDMSTISPTATRAFAERLAQQGVEMLDAPVSGGESGAIAGTLSIMVGGKAEVFERVRPLFDCLGRNIVHIGDHGAGQVAKACNQIVAAVTIEAVAEALTFARRNDVDPARVRAALLGGFAGSKIMEMHGQRMLDNDFRPGFKASLHRKDMRIVMEVAQQLGIELPAAELAERQLEALVDAGGADLDSSALIKVLERLTGKAGRL